MAASAIINLALLFKSAFFDANSSLFHPCSDFAASVIASWALDFTCPSLSSKTKSFQKSAYSPPFSDISSTFFALSSATLAEVFVISVNEEAITLF